MKKQGNGILYGMFGVVIVIYTPKIFCVYKGILFYHSSFAKLMTRVIVTVCKSVWKFYQFKELQWIRKNSMNPWKFRGQGLSVI